MTAPSSRSTSTRSRRLPLLLILAGACFLIGLVLFAALFSGKRPSASGDVLVQGRQIYESTCAGCHGSAGQGHAVPNAPPLNNTGDIWAMTPGELRTLVRGGTHEGMPAFGQRLNETEVDAVLTYIQTWWSAEQRAGYEAGGQSEVQR